MFLNSYNNAFVRSTQRDFPALKRRVQLSTFFRLVFQCYKISPPLRVLSLVWLVVFWLSTCCADITAELVARARASIHVNGSTYLTVTCAYSKNFLEACNPPVLRCFYIYFSSRKIRIYLCQVNGLQILFIRDKKMLIINLNFVLFVLFQVILIFSEIRLCK